MKNLFFIILLFISVRLSAQCTFSVVASYTAPSCPTCCDGIIAASVQGAICSPAASTLQPLGISTPNWTYANLCAGSYTVEVGDVCFCFGICGVSLPSGPTSIFQTNFSKENIRIYPNPVSSSIYILNNQNDFGNSEIEIINTLGQVVLKLKYKAEIDVSELSNGCYTLKAITKNEAAYYSKFIKQ